MPTPADVANRLAANIESVIVGKPEAVRVAVTGLLADGHILVDDVPGVAKTMLARCLALSIGATFRQIGRAHV